MARADLWGLSSRMLGLYLAAATVLSAAPARAAEPSVWSAAARPIAKRHGDAIAKVDRWLSEEAHLRRLANSAGQRTALLHRARRTLEGVGAALSARTDLRMRLARSYYGLFNVEKDRQRLEQAVVQLLFVTRSNTPLLERAEALNDLAICYARLGKHEAEIAAYAEALAIEPHAESRAVLLANRAEAFMVRGRILNAVQGYRLSLDATPSALYRRIGVTTMWGLGVALDRSGDLQGALAQIALARKYDPADERIRSDSWFYVPPYDNSWYHALGAWQSARNSKDALLRRAFYDEAIGMWRRYIAEAPPNDRWLPLASQRLSSCERERDQTESRKR
jgi:tetratricopeptide (TPR) repeat protein